MRRAPTGMTSDKCSICGFVGGQVDADGTLRFRFRKKDRPCNSCKSQMEKDAEELKTLRARLITRKNEGEDKVYLVAYHPYFPHSDHEGALADALRTMIGLIGVAKFGDDLRGGYSGNLPRILAAKGDSLLASDFRHTFSKTEADALQRLFEEIKNYGEHAYTEGKRRGSDILLSLQAGEIGTADFENKKESRY